MGRSTPYFFNDRGAPILLIGAKEFRCIGASPPFDHPHIYLDMGSDAEIVCPYCSTLFRYDAAVGDLDARPVFEPQARQIGPPQLTPAKQNSVALALAGSPGPRTLRRLEKTRIVRVLVWIVRFCAWYSLVVAIEVAIAKLFELIAESGQDWLHAAGEFQKRFVMAVDQLQPWQLYEIYINQPAPVTISQNVSLLLELRRAVHTILQLVTSPNTFVSTLSAIGFAVSLMASWYLVVQRPARTHDAAGYLVWWLVLGSPATVVLFSLSFFILKAMLSFGGWMLGHLVELGELYSTFAAVLTLLFMVRVRTEHAIVHWLEHQLERLAIRRRPHGLERWEDPVV